MRDFRFLKLPRRLGAADYDRTRSKCVEFFSRLPNVVAVYQMGSVRHPGISDLDLIAVFSRSAGGPVPDYRSCLDERDLYTLMHSPFAIDEPSFRVVNLFFRATNLELLWGREVEREELLHPEPLDSLLAAEFAIRGLASLLRQLRLGQIKVRPTLCEMGSLRYDLELARLGPGEFPEAEALTRRVSSLRSGWFDRGGLEGELVETMQEGVAVLARFLRKLEGEADGERTFDRARIRLGAWNNYLLTARGSSPRVVESWISPVLDRALGRSGGGHAQDLRWMAKSCVIPVSRSILARLAGAAEAGGPFERRAAAIGEYRRFLRRLGGGFSMLCASPDAAPARPTPKQSLLQSMHRCLFA
jgi:hypothetical protein